MPDRKLLTWGDIATLEYGRAMRGYQGMAGPVRVFGTNGPIGWTLRAQSDGPGVIIGRKGAYRGVHYSSGPFWVIDTAFYLRPTRAMDLRWAYYAIKSQSVNALDSGSAIPSTSRADFYSLEVLVPPIAEQHATASLLGALDDKIAVNERICDKYEEMLRLEFGKLGVDAEATSAREVTVADLMDLNPATPAPKGDEAVYVEMAVLPTRSARVKRWSRRAPKSGTRFMNGDTVMARITPCLENGKVAFVDFMRDGEVGVGSTEFIVLRAHPGVPSHLPYFLARSQRFQAHAIQNMSGSSGRQRVGVAPLAPFPVCRPDAPRLNRFGDTAATAFAHMKSLDAESRYLGELRDLLLPKLMSGEISVREAERIGSEAY